MAKRVQPNWAPPSVGPDAPLLKLYNSLTRKKEVFIPINGQQITWYSCGPTVYDASHMGHARSYISFDILRRVLSNYFGYNIFYVMNITDIDDKIIKRARHTYLFKNYCSANKSASDVLEDMKEALADFQVKVTANTDPDKKVMLDNIVVKTNESINNLMKIVDSSSMSNIVDLIQNAREPLSDWLDKKYGADITDNKIFSELPSYWEDRFHEDMKNLNVLYPDVLTRVSEYVPQIIAYIQKIIDNKLAYEVNGSVYFDVAGFDKIDKHHYAKLVPEAYGDTSAINEAEGDLSVTADRLTEKRSPNDFALWKSSRVGEPSWDSPWGKGRPGWHIECSAMASDVLGSQIDIHTGGVDLKFPHHDNELAQSEAYYGNADWVKYFLHTGHLTIAGCKMSKSLKNFITIEQALARHTATQLRLAFLLHSWKDTLDYSDNTMDMAIGYEKMLNEFFLNVKDLTRHITTCEPRNCFNAWDSLANDLQGKFAKAQQAVHAALCDNIDTRTVLSILRDLISASNNYIKSCKFDNLHAMLLRRIAEYVTDIFHIFGAIKGPRGGIGFPLSASGVDLESTIMPYLTALAEFRDNVRDEAKSLKAIKLLQLCDQLRDATLPELGVRLEDREGAPSAVKVVGKDVLMKEREEKLRLEEEQKKKKAEQKLLQEQLKAQREAQSKINPKDMFKAETDKYSKFDDEGMPTHDQEGKELSKGQLKKLQKLYQTQLKKYTDYMQSVN
uniref:Cysteine--tRNA ligase, cytoplasmic n=1 Tax=Xenopsylla cheopis TaxID=163159 RepID=A0A6M2DE76_XENCH